MRSDNFLWTRAAINTVFHTERRLCAVIYTHLEVMIFMTKQNISNALIAMLTPLFAPPAQSMAVTAVPRANISISVIAGRLVMPM